MSIRDSLSERRWTRGYSRIWFDKPKVTHARYRGQILRQARFPENFNGLYCCRFSVDGNMLATSFGAGVIQTRDSSTLDVKQTQRGQMADALPVMCIRWDPVQRDTFYASSCCGRVFTCKTNGEFSCLIQENKNQINTCDVNSKGELLATSGKDGGVRVYDTRTAKNKITWIAPRHALTDEEVELYHRMRVFCVRFHPQSDELVITGGWDDRIKVWDVRVKGGCVRNIKGPHICGDAIDVRRNVIVSGSWVVSNSIQLWDIGSSRLIEAIVPKNRPTSNDGEFLYCLQFFDGDPFGDMVLVGGSGTGCAEIISLSKKEVIGSFKGHGVVQAVDSCSNTIAYGGMETVIRVANFS